MLNTISAYATPAHGGRLSLSRIAGLTLFGLGIYLMVGADGDIAVMQEAGQTIAMGLGILGIRRAQDAGQ